MSLQCCIMSVMTFMSELGSFYLPLTPPRLQIIERMERAGILPDDYTIEAVKNRRALRTHLKRTFGM